MAQARILILDDDSDFCNIIQTNLKNRGYETAVCADPSKCEEMLKGFSTELLILDLMFGGRMEGELLARRLRSGGGAWRDIPILMLTGVRQQTGFFWLGDPRDPTHLPVDEVMEKPVKPADFARTVEQLLRKRAGAAAGRKRTLLVVDDNPALRAACVEIFSRSPEYVVVTAQDGVSGLEMVRRFSPDVLLLDLLMPGMDGLEVIRTVRRDFPGLPVIGVTGDRMAASSAQRRLKEKVQWLLKPFTPAELREAVRTALEQAAPGCGGAA